MQTLPMLTGMVLTGLTLFGQEYKATVDNAPSTKVVLTAFPGELSIEGYDGTDVILTSTDEDLGHMPDKAKGLKPIYSGGTDNTGLAVTAEKNGSELRLTCLLGFGHEGHYHIKVPNHVSIAYKSNCGYQGSVKVTDVSGEVEVNTCADVELRNVTGPLVINTISGGINVVFSQVNKDKPISLASISGDVDVTIPASTPANIEMSSLSGGVYTDFDLQRATKDGLPQVGSGHQGIKSTINGGGVDLKITNISGNIYLRKG